MSSLAIVEKKPSLNGGGCAGGVLFHLLDWHRRLARKRRLFSPRRLLPSSLRSAPRRLPAPPPTLPPPAPHSAAADGAAPGVVARLMGLESWPGRAGGSAGAPRPQKQRKVEPSPPDGDSAVVLVLPTSRRPSAPALVPAAVAAPRSHHGSDLPARSPRRTRLVHAAVAKLLEPGARASSRASARLALAYACSSPQHRKGGHSGALHHGSGTADDFLSRSGSTSLERSTRLQPPVPPAETECDRAVVSRRHENHSTNSGDTVISATSTVVLPRKDFGVADMSKSSSDVDAVHKERRLRNEGMNSCAKVRSSISSVRAGDERFRKRATPTRPEVSADVNPVSLTSSTSQFRHTRESISAGRRVTCSSSGPRREFMGSVTGQGNTNRKDVLNRSGVASTSRISNNGSGPKRVSRNVGHVAAASNTNDRNAVVFASRSSMKPVARASSHSNESKSRRPSRRASNTSCARMLAADPKCIEASASVMATSEKDEFNRLLKAKANELGISDRIEFTSADALSVKLTAPVLQELISALTNDMNTSTSQCINYSDASAPLHSNENVGCIDQSGYAFSDDHRSPDLQKCYQDEQDVDSSAASINNEPNQPSPVSVLEACFSNDTSSLGSPVEKNEGKDLLLSMDNKMEDLFNFESDIVDLAMSIDTTETGAKEIFRGDGILSCLESFVTHDFKCLESRLHSVEEALSNVELLLGSGLMDGTTSALALHPFIMEMLKTSVGAFGGEESLCLTEEKKYQHTNFLFDCIVESLDSKFRNFGKCGYMAWLKLPRNFSKDLLKQELLEVISNWKESGAALRRVADKELDQVTTNWGECQIEVFDISVAVENDILEALVVELALDLR